MGPEGSFFTAGMGMELCCSAYQRGWVLQWSASAPDRGRNFSSPRSTRNCVRRQGDAGSPDAEAEVQWSRAQCWRRRRRSSARSRSAHGCSLPPQDLQKRCARGQTLAEAREKGMEVDSPDAEVEVVVYPESMAEEKLQMRRRRGRSAGGGGGASPARTR